MLYDYFYNDDSEQYQFLQMPWFLLTDEQFKNVSSDAKILYSLLLNRTSLSKKNNWLDERGRIYLIYPIDEIRETLNCGKEKAVKSMQELTKIGLIQTIRRGLGKPNLIYVKNFATSLKYQSENKKEPEPRINSQKSEKQTSGSPKNRPLEVRKTDLLKSEKQTQVIPTYINIDFRDNDSSQCQVKSKKLYTSNHDIDSDSSYKQKTTSRNEKEPHISNADQSTEIKNPFSKNINNSAEHILTTYDYNTYYEIVKQNIEYSHFQVHSREIDLVDELVNCIVDVICSTGDTVKIGKENKPRDMVIAQYLKIDSSDIDHIIDRYKEQRHKIKHLHSYLKTMLYTIKQENGFYYVNAVRADGAVW